MKHYVFVYGSLKQGYGNHRLLETSTFIGKRLTRNTDFYMVSLHSFPGVLKTESGEGFSIMGELYEVDDNTLKNLDILEGNGHFYKRELVDIHSYPDKAWMYVLMDMPRSFYSSDGRVVEDEDLRLHEWN
jgi:gamma-glutamylcyclotransferase (GGCT)/AIG2-like uncharacterized protein YtfP